MVVVKSKIFDGMLLQLRSDFVDGVEIYTVTVESSNTTNIQPLVKCTRLQSEAKHVFNLWQAGLHNTCGAFV